MTGDFDVEEFCGHYANIPDKGKVRLPKGSCVRFMSAIINGSLTRVEIEHEGVILQSIHVPKYNSVTHIIAVYKDGNIRQHKPNLRWIDSRLCVPCKGDHSHVENQRYFDIDNWNLKKSILKRK